MCSRDESRVFSEVVVLRFEFCSHVLISWQLGFVWGCSSGGAGSLGVVRRLCVAGVYTSYPASGLAKWEW